MPASLFRAPIILQQPCIAKVAGFKNNWPMTHHHNTHEKKNGKILQPNFFLATKKKTPGKLVSASKGRVSKKRLPSWTAGCMCVYRDWFHGLCLVFPASQWIGDKVSENRRCISVGQGFGDVFFFFFFGFVNNFWSI